MANKLFGSLSRRTRSVLGKTRAQKNVVEMVAQIVAVEEEVPIDLDPISGAIHNGCMGLPQELIDAIMDVLRDDPQTLKACSLTCKAMFASTRRLIHQTLHLAKRNNERVLTQEQRQRLIFSGSYYNPDVELSFISYMGERGFLRYIRRVHIHNSCVFSPNTLLPHYNRFQSLDRVHTFIIEGYNTIPWAGYQTLYFIHLYPTLTSLTLSRPRGDYQRILQFALQFPKLENLCIEWLEHEGFWPNIPSPALTNKSPPLCGNLRLAGLESVGRRLIDFTLERGMGIQFRSVELEDSFSSSGTAQRILNACAGTIEDIIITPRGLGYMTLRYLRFMGMTTLRRLTIRTAFTPVAGVTFGFISISTITSPVFREVVLELGGHPSRFDGPSPVFWGRWEEIDRLIEQRFVKDRDFRLIFRTVELEDREGFQRHAEGTFPLLASRGCLRFETIH